MRRIILSTVAMLMLSFEVSAGEPEWILAVDLDDPVPAVTLTVRYGGCAKVNRVTREGSDGVLKTLFQASATVVLDTADSQIDCACEPLGSSMGTGAKHCPGEQCAADQQCVCSKKCLPIEDECVPAGSVTWSAEDSDGGHLAGHSQVLAAAAGNCPFAVEDEEEAPSSSGGCGHSARGSGQPLVLVLLAAALLFLAGRSSWLGPAALALCLVPAQACSDRQEGKGRKKQELPEVRTLEAVQVEIEGSPYEPVIATQTELLEFFETSNDPVQTLRKLRKWKKQRLEPFERDCAAALAFFTQEPEKRLGYVSRAGQVWAVVQQRVKAVSKDWGAGEKREVGILLNQFSCR